MAEALAGTTALVTGASSGIGHAVAMGLARLGAAVALVARRDDRLKDLAERIADAGGRAEVIPADLRAPGAAGAAVAEAATRLGGLDIVVNNAGLGFLGSFEALSPAQRADTVALNVHAAAEVAHAALPHLVKAAATTPRGVADLVMMGSIAGLTPAAYAGLYSATKAAVHSLSETLRQEYAPRKVRISTVAPGGTLTEFTSHSDPTALATIGANFTIDRFLDATDIADAVDYLVTRPSHVAINEIVVRPTTQVP